MTRILSLAAIFTGTAFAGAPSFDEDIQQLLEARCFDCHSDGRPKNGLDLRTIESAVAGGKTGPALQPGSLRDSLIWHQISMGKMPPDEEERLTPDERDQLRVWILAGAPKTKAEAAKAEIPGQVTVEARTEPRGVRETAELIDDAVRAQLVAADVEPAPPADDAEFLRRVFLDLSGRVPAYDETVAFLDDPDPDKRAKLVDARLADPDFGAHFAIEWHRLLIPRTAGAYGRIPHEKFRAWLAEQFNSGRGWDAVVAEMLTADGYLPSNKDNDLARKKDAKLQPQNIATAFINVHNTEGRPQPKGIVASAARLFLAQSMECAQCHDHPQAKWTQEDFWAAAAFFERVRYEKAVYGETSMGRLMEPAEGKDLVYNDEKKMRHAFVPAVYGEPVVDLQNADGQRTGRMIRARFLDGFEPAFEPEGSHRAVFAAWATGAENPYFARAMTNRVWQQLLGRGFVEPVDDMSEDNPPSHPKLLAELSAEFAASGFDLKHLIRCICNSDAYGRTSAAPPSDPVLFARQSLKQMTEEQLLASLEIVAPTFKALLEEDARDKNPNLYRKGFLEIYATGSGPLPEHTRGLQQALRMMNGDGKYFNRVAASARTSDGLSIAENVTAIYLQVLSRRPTDAELERMTAFVETAQAEIAEIDPKRLPQPRKDRPDAMPDAYADVFWALLNSGEFILNH